MAISFVGGAANGANNGGDVTLTLPTCQEGDVVYVWSGQFNRNGSEGLPTTSNYSEVVSIVGGSGRSLRVSRKRMGATPDTEVTVGGSGAGPDAIAAALHVLRGVDDTTPEDATPTTNTSDGDGPAITTATDGAYVLSGAIRAHSHEGTPPANYSQLQTFGQIDTQRIGVGLALREISSAGTEDPGTWLFEGAAADGSITVAVRPAGAGTTVTVEIGAIEWVQ